MFLFPAIDLRDGKVVRLLKGDYQQQTTYADDPVEQAKVFEEAGATWIHVVDLDGAKSGRMVHLEQIQAICNQTNLKVQVGGGIRSSGAIDRLLAIGVERAIIGTAALENWSWFEGLMGNPTYRHRIVLGLDAREGKLAVSGWQETTETTALDIAKKVSDWPLAAIVFTDIATDGTLKGPNVASTEELAKATCVPVIASGGVGTLEDLRALSQLPVLGTIVGRAIYEQAFDLSEAIQVVESSESAC